MFIRDKLSVHCTAKQIYSGYKGGISVPVAGMVGKFSQVDLHVSN